MTVHQADSVQADLRVSATFLLIRKVRCVLDGKGMGFATKDLGLSHSSTTY